MDAMAQLQQLVKHQERGVIASNEFVDKFVTVITQFPQCKVDALILICDHPSEAVQGTLASVVDLLRRCEESEKSKDLNHVILTSPLQPGIRITLSGGYTAAYEPPAWLGGREHVGATFVRFAQGKAGSTPVAFVAIEEPIAVAEESGRFALLKLLSGGSWGESETVVVHLVDGLPSDVDAFYKADPFPYPNAVETHATYRVAEAEEDSTSD